MASELAIYYTPMHFMWGVKSGATPGINDETNALTVGIYFYII